MSIAHGIRRAGVIGAGQMGLGIAFVSAVHAKIPVLLHDRSSAQIKSGLALFDKIISKDVSKGKLTSEAAKEARDRVTVVDDLKGFRDADMVIEAASENLAIKQGIFRTLSAELSPKTILATNTSSISITKIAASTIPEGKTAADPEGKESASRVVGLHFFNPVPVMKLVELIAAVQTSEETLDRARAYATACGKEVTHSKDVPGFVANGLLMPFINEAIMMLEKGIATREDIDKTLKLGMNHPMGPLQLADFIGLDTCLAIQQTIYNGTADSKYRPSVLLERMVDAQWYGKKSGKGFYDYPSQ
ncbi:3-hydroxyacyl-CoA dehydrogenase [Ganoderma leucocontextum]|nr:3-hydroxyacyl-CoA dehydrogenase [Ganoderma leucocontextum]